MKMPPLRFLEGLKHQGHSEGSTRTRGQRLWHKSTPWGRQVRVVYPNFGSNDNLNGRETQ